MLILDAAQHSSMCPKSVLNTLFSGAKDHRDVMVYPAARMWRFGRNCAIKPAIDPSPRSCFEPGSAHTGHMNPHFSPWGTEPQPCWHCTSYLGLIYEGSAACCGNSIGPLVRAMPAHGCSIFEREPGSDDEPDSMPAALMAPAAARVLLAAAQARV